MYERITNDEIYARFPNEWILLKDPEVGPKDELIAGTLLCHSKDREEIHRVAMANRPGDFAVFYTGPPSDYPVIV